MKKFIKLRKVHNNGIRYLLLPIKDIVSIEGNTDDSESIIKTLRDNRADIFFVKDSLDSIYKQIFDL